VRIKGEPLTLASDEGVREVITLHLNAQLVRRQYRIRCLSGHSKAPFGGSILHHQTFSPSLIGGTAHMSQTSASNLKRLGCRSFATNHRYPPTFAVSRIA